MLVLLLKLVTFFLVTLWSLLTRLIFNTIAHTIVLLLQGLKGSGEGSLAVFQQAAEVIRTCFEFIFLQIIKSINTIISYMFDLLKDSITGSVAVTGTAAGSIAEKFRTSIEESLKQVPELFEQLSNMTSDMVTELWNNYKEAVGYLHTTLLPPSPSSAITHAHPSSPRSHQPSTVPSLLPSSRFSFHHHHHETTPNLVTAYHSSPTPHSSTPAEAPSHHHQQQQLFLPPSAKPSNLTTSPLVVRPDPMSSALGMMVNRAMNGGDPEEVKRVGNELYKNGNFSEALVLYDRAVSMSPENVAYRGNRAATLIALGRLVKCLLSYLLIRAFYRA
ncbi:hypothetical protein RIF29_29544 [Crotalaria pallida]|uniref:Uncharacterized protein n=1 Tax=Crotalaria pallida TaxID=3830 RepID=A0AAN9EJZ0_CROPI